MKAKETQQIMMAKAGSLYLALILTGVLAHFFVRAGVIEPGDGAATAQNILDRNFIFRLGFVFDLTYIVSFILLGLQFFRMFERTDKNNSRMLLAIIIVSNAIMGMNMLNQFAAYYVLSGAGFLDVFPKEQLQALSLLFMNLHGHGVHFGYIFFGLWLFPLGKLLMKSEMFGGIAGKIVGSILIAGFVGYEIDFLSYFLFSGSYETISSFATIPADLGEFSLCMWLIAKGVNTAKKPKVVYTAVSKS